MDIPSVVWLVDTDVQIFVGVIHIFGMQYVDEFEIDSMCHHVDNTLEGFSYSGHCYHQDWFKS